MAAQARKPGARASIGRGRSRMRCAGAVRVLIAAAGGGTRAGGAAAAAGPHGGAGAAPTVVSVTPDISLDQSWRQFGDSSGQGGWAGADGTYSLPIPGGHDIWLFNDTFLGPVNADESLPATADFIHNSAVLTSPHADHIETFIEGGTSQQPQSLVGPTNSPPTTFSLRPRLRLESVTPTYGGADVTSTAPRCLTCSRTLTTTGLVSSRSTSPAADRSAASPPSRPDGHRETAAEAICCTLLFSATTG